MRMESSMIPTLTNVNVRNQIYYEETVIQHAKSDELRLTAFVVIDYEESTSTKYRWNLWKIKQ